MSHRNAPLTPEGRRRLCERVNSGRPICHLAAGAGIARQTLGKWHTRWVEDGFAGLADHSSRPVSCPNRTDQQVEDLVEDLLEYLRRSMKLGPVMLVAELAELEITILTQLPFQHEETIDNLEETVIPILRNSRALAKWHTLFRIAAWTARRYPNRSTPRDARRLLFY